MNGSSAYYSYYDKEQSFVKLVRDVIERLAVGLSVAVLRTLVCRMQDLNTRFLDRRQTLYHRGITVIMKNVFLWKIIELVQQLL